jgi:hypothetical protein
MRRAALTPADVDLDTLGPPRRPSRALSESVVMHANIVALPAPVETSIRMWRAILDQAAPVCDNGPV